MINNSLFFLQLDSFGASAAVYIHNSSNFYKTVSYYDVDLCCKIVICVHSISNAHWEPCDSAWLLFANSNFCLLGQVGAPCERCGMKSSCPKESVFHGWPSFFSTKTYVQLRTSTCVCVLVHSGLWGVLLSGYTYHPSSLHTPTVVEDLL